MLRVSIFQFSTFWLDHKRNLAEVEVVCRKLTGNTDLLLLPEMFNTGYVLDTTKLSEDIQVESLSQLQVLAATYRIVIGGSIPYTKNGNWYNRFVFVDHTGVVQGYDKIQLFAPAGEKKFYSAGERINNFNFLNWQVQPLVCYDLRFPYLSFQYESPELLIYSANWPIARVHHWRSLLIARAIENQCYVVGINRTGTDENGYEYPGSSTIIDFSGQILQEMDENEGFITEKIIKSEMTLYRKKLPFLNDRKFI
jgi:predicted amidohydrolase